MDHEDRMPCPTQRGGELNERNTLQMDVRTTYDERDTVGHGQLTYAITPYLARRKDRNIRDNDNVRSLVMTCPAFVRNPQYTDPGRMPKPNDPDAERYAYRLRKYANGATLWQYSVKMSAIGKPAAEAAIVDLDRALRGASPGTMQTGGGAAWKSAPDEPVHQVKRNYGFFDGSVQVLTTEDHPKSMVMVSGKSYGWFNARN
jgi:prepilin-type processing-associated H-X9-DG protein